MHVALTMVLSTAASIQKNIAMQKEKYSPAALDMGSTSPNFVRYNCNPVVLKP